MDHINVLLHFISFVSGISFIALSYVFYAKSKSQLLKSLITVDMLYTILLVIDSLDIYIRKNSVEHYEILHTIVTGGQFFIGFIFLYYLIRLIYMITTLVHPISKVNDHTKTVIVTCLGTAFLILPLWFITTIFDFLPLFMYKIPYTPLLYFTLNMIGLLSLKKHLLAQETAKEINKEGTLFSEKDEAAAIFTTLQTTYHITERENEIINSIIQGNSNQTISTQLFISLNTVKNHIYHIYQKMGIKNRYELIHLITKLKK